MTLPACRSQSARSKQPCASAVAARLVLVAQSCREPHVVEFGYGVRKSVSIQTERFLNDVPIVQCVRGSPHTSILCQSMSEHTAIVQTTITTKRLRPSGPVHPNTDKLNKTLAACRRSRPTSQLNHLSCQSPKYSHARTGHHLSPSLREQHNSFFFLQVQSVAPTFS